MKKTFLLSLVFPVIMAMLSGCGTLSGKLYDYRMIFLSTGRFDIVNLRIESKDGQWAFFGAGSILVPHAQTVHAGPLETAPNGQFIITWDDITGQKHRAEMDMSAKVSRFFHGEMVFIIDGENRLRTETYPQIRTFDPSKLKQ